MKQIFLGKPHQSIIDWINGRPPIPPDPPATQSPYFEYDSNRVITRLHQGEPNVYEEGTYINYYDGEEKPYSGWTYGGSDVVENYATAIGNNAFDDSDYAMVGIPPSKKITGNITFQNVTSIGSYAFRFCSFLANVTMPNVTSIGDLAFESCNTLMNVTIGSGIQRIGRAAFSTYTNPITLTIGKSVAEVREMGTIDYDANTNVPYSEWGLPSGSTIVCVNNETIPIE